MENAGEIRGIARYEPQRALVIESLETIEQLPGNFQVRLHSQPHEYQLIHFLWCAYGERCRPAAGQSKIRLDGCTTDGTGIPFPYRHTQSRYQAHPDILVISVCKTTLTQPATGVTADDH